MDTETAPAAQKSWLARHPFIVLGGLLAVCLGPFLNQAFQTDDTLFVWTAQWIQKHPADFFGFKVNWWGSDIPMWMANYNPPLLSYLLAGVGSCLGWGEVALHAAGLGLAMAVAAGIYALGQRWCERPLLAAVIAVLTPAFLVLSTTLMCDVTMLACWIWAVVAWERAEAEPQGRWGYVLAGALAGAAVLAKYSAVTLVPLLAVLGVLSSGMKGGKWIWKALGLAMPFLILAGYNGLTSRMYGHGLFFLAENYARTRGFGYPGGWLAKGIMGLTFAGGGLLPVFFLAPWLWRPRRWLLGGAIIFGLPGLLFWLRPDPGLLHPWTDPDGSLIHFPDFRLQVVVLAAAGLHLWLLAGRELWQRRDRITLVLVLWMGSVFFFATVLNWTVNARSFLPAVPAVAMLAARRRNAGDERWLAAPLGLAAAIGLCLIMANYQLANSGRTAATRIVAEYKTPEHTLWFDGHSGFQYYMEQAGGRPLNLENSVLLPGDIVAAALIGDFIVLPPGSVEPLNNLSLRLHSWMNIQARSARSAAGFYTSDTGPVPFALGHPQAQKYFMVKVHARLQFQTPPDNPEGVLAGSLPSFSKPICRWDNAPIMPDLPAAGEDLRQARQLVMDGQIAAAAQRYEAALKVQPDNPAALSQLAWILATSTQPELRDSQRAVQLAKQAAKLTELRQGNLILTLATAYAADGQFQKGGIMAQSAYGLGLLTGQPELAANSLKVMTLCAANLTSAASAGGADHNGASQK